MNILNNKNIAAIVTGGASGMGEAVASTLASLGVKVAILDKNYEAAVVVAKRIEGNAFACDVSDAESVERVFRDLAEVQGGLRICVNCAGIAPAQRMVGKDGPMPLEHFKQVININLVGTFNVMRLSAFHMMSLDPLSETGERGVIINTASVAAFEGQIGQLPYSASKGGVVSMTLPAARELAQFGIRVNTIAPGIIATPMLLAMPQNVQESLAASVPFPKRLGRPEEFARLVCHIIENEMINGAVLRLDGALRMQAR